jgi:predicted PurR-regulated permease PerM
VQPALISGALAFLGEFLPTVGPVIVAFPALFVALSMGPTKFFIGSPLFSLCTRSKRPFSYHLSSDEKCV